MVSPENKNPPKELASYLHILGIVGLSPLHIGTSVRFEYHPLNGEAQSTD
jgi:hypothetical protein